MKNTSNQKYNIHSRFLYGRFVQFLLYLIVVAMSLHEGGCSETANDVIFFLFKQ